MLTILHSYQPKCCLGHLERIVPTGSDQNKQFQRRACFTCGFFGCPEAINPTRAQTLLREAVSKVGVAGPTGVEPATPSTENKGDGFSHLLDSVLRLESCQWNWVVAAATMAFDWSLMVPARPPNPM